VKKPELTQERLQEVLHYDPASGEFRWRVRKKGNLRAGDIAGTRMRSDYWCIHVDGRTYRAHQLAWLYMKGEWGRPLIDHCDGNPFNNRWRNLRLSTRSNNGADQARNRSNTSGFKGVIPDRRSGRWVAKIAKQRRRYHLGSFATAEEAHQVHAAAARLLFGQFARTK
jgi:hypothetical protein